MHPAELTHELSTWVTKGVALTTPDTPTEHFRIEPWSQYLQFGNASYAFTLRFTAYGQKRSNL